MNEPTVKRDFITEREAWSLFKVAAIGEAFSWLLLLQGILIQYLIPANKTWVAVGGSIHGIVFLAYFAAVLGLWKVLKFTPWLGLIALAVSVVPFGTLILEQWLERKRKREANNDLRQVAVRAVIRDGKRILALQPQDRVFWCIPGGVILTGESVEAAVTRTVTEQTGIAPILGKMLRTNQYTHRDVERLELFFEITNIADYLKAKTWPNHPDFEDIQWIPLDGSKELQPNFLITA